MLFAMKEHRRPGRRARPARQRRVHRRSGRNDSRRGGEVRIQRAGADQRPGRHPGLPLGRRRRDHRRRVQGRPTRASARTAGTACPQAREFGGQGMPTLVSTAVLEMWKASNMAFSLCQMLTLGAVEAITHHATRRAEAALPSGHGRRALDRHDEHHRAAGRLRPRGHPHQGRPGRRPLPHQRHQDLHHLGRARHGARTSSTSCWRACPMHRRA